MSFSLTKHVPVAPKNWVSPLSNATLVWKLLTQAGGAHVAPPLRWLAEKAACISARQSARPQPPVERGVVVVTTTPAKPVLAGDEAPSRRNHADHGHPTGYQALYVFLLEECRGLLRNKIGGGGGVAGSLTSGRPIVTRLSRIIDFSFWRFLSLTQVLTLKC